MSYMIRIPNSSVLSASVSGVAKFAENLTAYDKQGRITARNEVNQGITSNFTYQYDDLGRLQQATTPSGTMIYGWDTNDNRTSVNVNGSTTSATYDAQDRILTAGTETFTHTPDGHLASRTDSATSQTTTYAYLQNHLTEVQLPNGSVRTYKYDALGNRVAAYDNATMHTGYIYDGSTLVGLTDGSGALTTRFVYGTSPYVPDYMVKNGTTYRLITDHLGSVRQVVDVNSGQIVQSIDYDSFGNIIQNSNPNFQPFAYATGLVDGVTNLIHLGARDYDPSLGRFIERDPQGFDAGTNNYAYVNGDPINFIDPTGFAALDCVREVATVLSWVPGPIGIGASVVSAGINLYQGNTTEALWSLAGVIPGGRLMRAEGKLLSRGAEKAASRLDDIGGGIRPRSNVLDDVPSPGASCNSFTPDTDVVMADGSTKDIDKIQLGDKVLSTNPDTGETTSQTVTNTIDGYGTKTLVDVELDNGSSITATDHHPFYVNGKWTDAVDLQTGGTLRQSNGATAIVASTTIRTTEDQYVTNLTVSQFHTYYVSTGETDVLVHNAGCDEFARKLAKRNGGEIKTITPKTSDPVLGPYALSDEAWAYHTVVVKDGKVYDQFTGADGMVIEDWKQQWEYANDIDFGF